MIGGLLYQIWQESHRDDTPPWIGVDTSEPEIIIECLDHWLPPEHQQRQPN